MSEKCNNPFCKDCKFFRKVSNRYFTCNKFNLRMEPLNRTELKFGCWKEKESREIFLISPNFFGIGLNIKNLLNKNHKFF